ncbi:Na+:solute symporter [Candidatus Sumerlaeota bacterium]|nr:Na+:solute symporter [Candidatus Sumerlaeota bacterium]
MRLAGLDWWIIILYFSLTLILGVVMTRKAGKNFSSFFLSGRNMPWWLLGFSMVATTFSTDTPNLVTDIVRTNGVSGNFVWWAFLLTGMLTVFVYAKLWRRSQVLTDIEFYELRYSGKSAAFLRGFRSLYLGLFFNIMIMATVTLAAIKIGGVMLGLRPLETIFIACLITTIYSALGGLLGILITDFFEFIIAMVGSFAAAIIALRHPQVGGLAGLLSHPNVAGKLDLFPEISNTQAMLALLVVPFFVQWWSVWYPGSEPGGGGYIAQRMLSAKNEKHAIGATLFFNVCHYALRPWPWIIVALCSLVVFPDIASLREAFPNVAENVVRHDLGYSAMLTFLPAGILGLVVASLIAAYMSTISTHLNWGSSYVVHDFYKRFLKPEASDKELVNAGRICTFGLMILAGAVSLLLQNALQAFNILLQIGAGTGLLFILRWFWWRINAASEIAAMVISFLVAIYFQFIHTRVLGFGPVHESLQLVIGVGITTMGWIVVTYLTQPTDEKVLRKFYQKVQPGGPGWNKVVFDAEKQGLALEAEKGAWDAPLGILCMILGSVTVYSALFATGYWIYSKTSSAMIFTVISLAGAVSLFHIWKKLKIRSASE